MKKVKINNPFVTVGYRSPEYFCDRKEEATRLLNAIENERNVTLISPRRLGKTGLIHHVFNEINENKTHNCYYFDIFSTKNLHDFNLSFAKIIFGTLDSIPKKMMKNILSKFTHLRPKISFDPLTGNPQIEIALEKSNEGKETLDEIFNYLETSEKRCVVAIDEFQQIRNYPEKNIEALLRSYVQQLENVNFIFSGSQKHVMQNMFSDAAQPFYQSTEMLFLDRISLENYAHFAIEKFENRIDETVFEQIYNKVDGFTGNIQFILNRLYELHLKNYTKDDVSETIQRMVMENEPTFIEYKKLLTANQWDLLVAIASEKSVTAVTSGEFIEKHQLTSTSSVQTALNSLLDKEMILEENGSYSVYNKFFSLWLAYINEK